MMRGRARRVRLAIIAVFVLGTGCAPSTSPAGSAASAPPSVGVSPTTSGGTSPQPLGSPPASESTIDLATLTGRIVFDNSQDVWSINADGTDLTRLTKSPWPEFDATWSPDGTRIAFRSERDGDSEIWLMNADGSEPRRLARGQSPAWAPDGSTIVYASPATSDTASGLSLMNADGSGQHRVPNTDGGEYASWSPDGKRIAFNSNLTGGHVMYIVDVQGSGLVDLSSAGEGWQVDWSPGGGSILFTSQRDHTDNYTDIYMMGPDGSDVERLTSIRAYTPAWSPDGRYVVFSAPGLFVMRPDGSGTTRLPVNVGETSLPDWH